MAGNIQSIPTPCLYVKPTGGMPPVSFTYLRPDGVSTYLRPDGVSIYLRP